MQIRLRKRLGDLLVEEGIITEAQVEQALAAQKSTGRKLGDALIELGFLSEQQMLSFLSQQLAIPLIDLSRARVSMLKRYSFYQKYMLVAFVHWLLDAKVTLCVLQ